MVSVTLSRIQRPRTSRGQHRPRKRHQRFTFEQNFATILQQSAAFDTDLFRCHRDQTEKSDSHSGITSLWKQSLMSVIPNQAASIMSGSGPTSNFEKPSLEEGFTLLLRATTMSLCFRPSSLRTAKRPTFSLGSRVNRTIPRRASRRTSSKNVRRAPAPGQNTAQGRSTSPEYSASRRSAGNTESKQQAPVASTRNNFGTLREAVEDPAPLSQSSRPPKTLD